ncbi:MAG: type III pantothenate kinase [Candidatus Hydrogenedentes bacterium]|nr:type III pantothenate kinase [Candidatus Hydrogenedentota bacterium]
MLLVADVGNSHTVLGLYSGDELAAHWRVMTSNYRTTDEVRILLDMLFRQERIDPASVNGCCIASVVPPLNHSIEKACRLSFGAAPLFVGPGVRTGLVIQVENPKEVGADRIVDAVGAITEYAGPLIVVDFGTATTLDVVSGNAEYRGGVIVPGIQISADALCERCAKLPRVEIAKPATVIGRDTIAHIRSGLTYGYADLIDGLIGRMAAEMDESPTVVATGGFANLIAGIARRIDHVDPMLTLKGLKIVFAKNQPPGGVA